MKTVFKIVDSKDNTIIKILSNTDIDIQLIEFFYENNELHKTYRIGTKE